MADSNPHRRPGGKNSIWATIAHIDVQDGVLTVDGETRYSPMFSELMPGRDTAGRWVQKPKGGPRGRSKSRSCGDGWRERRTMRRLGPRPDEIVP